MPYGGGGGAQGSGGASPYRLWDASEAKAVALFVFSAVNGCSGLWSLDIWEGFFKPTWEGRPSYVRCGPKGLGNLAQASAWVVSPRDGKPRRGGGMPPYLRAGYSTICFAGISKTHSRSITLWSDAPTGLPWG